MTLVPFRKKNIYLSRKELMQRGSNYQIGWLCYWVASILSNGKGDKRQLQSLHIPTVCKIKTIYLQIYFGTRFGAGRATNQKCQIFRPSTIWGILKRLDYKKATEPGGIPVIPLKKRASEVTPILARLFYVLRTKSIPIMLENCPHSADP